MFTGLVEEIGHLIQREPLPGGGVRLTVTADVTLAGTAHGDSIAVNGVCLTVVDLRPQAGELAAGFAIDVMPETLRRTSLADLAPGSAVNLERAMLPTTRFGGHLVQGHVDGTGTIRSRQPSGEFDEVVIDVPESLARYLVPKGSITVDGVSLTVAATGADAAGAWCSVALIPTTLADTTLGLLQPGTVVNLEVDVIAKYVESMLAARA